MKWFVLVVLISIAALLLWNFGCRKNSKRKIDGVYGQTMEISDHKVVVDIKGAENKSVIVILPG